MRFAVKLLPRRKRASNGGVGKSPRWLDDVVLLGWNECDMGDEIGHLEMKEIRAPLPAPLCYHVRMWWPCFHQCERIIAKSHLIVVKYNEWMMG